MLCPTSRGIAVKHAAVAQQVAQRQADPDLCQPRQLLWSVQLVQGRRIVVRTAQRIGALLQQALAQGDLLLPLGKLLQAAGESPLEYGRWQRCGNVAPYCGS